MIQITSKEDCCGCTACAHICPVRCIEMCVDDEGFRYPRANARICIGCGRCEKACPCLNETESAGETTAYVCQIRDDTVLAESTSGGAFTAIAAEILHQGGIVYGAAFDENYRVVHTSAESREDLTFLRGSKYAQSCLGDIFPEVRLQLKAGRLVLFSGTPCQAAGLIRYLGKDYDNLWVIDTICRSIPSSKLWEAYVRKLADNATGTGDAKQNLIPRGGRPDDAGAGEETESAARRIAGIRFRSKTYGYHSGTFVCEYRNGTRYSGSNRVDPYMKAFHAGLCSRPSCYNCRFKTIDRVSDYTLFDCWQPESLVPGLKDDDRGWSGVLAHSAKGKDLLHSLALENEAACPDVKLRPEGFGYDGMGRGCGAFPESVVPSGNSLILHEVDVERALSYTGGMAVQSAPCHPSRDDFYIVLNREGVDAAFHQFVPVSGKDRMIERSKYVLHQTGLLAQVKKLKCRTQL